MKQALDDNDRLILGLLPDDPEDDTIPLLNKDGSDARPCILVDTREQRPARFSGSVRTQSATLPTGDYSIVGFTHLVAIERKAGEDLWGCCGAGRARFVAELERLRDYPLRAVVVEESIDWFLMTPPRGRITGETVIRSTIGWQMDFGVPFVWAGHRNNAAACIERFLTRIPRKFGKERAA
jgi:ERCC4-type nuclease